jgi:hypothetical protein
MGVNQMRFTNLQKILTIFWLMIGALLGGPSSSVYAATLVHDDFKGSALQPIWRLHQGYASVQKGWVTLSGSTDGTRGGYIVTGEGSAWSDYRLSTRVVTEGGGTACAEGPPCAWYVAMVKVRVQTLRGDVRGTYYDVQMWTPPSEKTTHRGAFVGLLKVVDDEVSIVSEDPAPAGAINDYDNKLDIEVIGTRIRVYVNDRVITDYTDQTENPIMTGGVSLGALWESTTRYDYVDVQELGVFATFDARAELTLGRKANDDAYRMDGFMTLAPSSNGIDPLNEPVTLRLGSFSATLPAGSFEPYGTAFVYNGPAGSARLSIQITPLRHFGAYSFRSTLANGDLAATTLQPQVQLTIGDDQGQATLDLAQARFSKGKFGWDWVFGHR